MEARDNSFPSPEETKWSSLLYEPTQPGFYLGDGMKAPPRPRITTAKVGSDSGDKTPMERFMHDGWSGSMRLRLTGNQKVA